MKYAPYSFSKINTFFDCQKKFEFTYVNKIDIDEGYTDPTYFVRGRFIHKYIADRLSGGDGMLDRFGGIDVDDKLHLVECADNTLDNEYISMTYDFETTDVERQINLNQYLKPSNKARAALSGYVDYMAVQDDFAVVVDWKSGKHREKPNYSQLELYAIWIMGKYTGVNEIDMIFYYVEHDKMSVKTVTRDEVIDFKDRLENSIDIIENTETFEISETKQCIHCKFCNTCMDKYGILGLDKS